MTVTTEATGSAPTLPTTQFTLKGDRLVRSLAVGNWWLRSSLRLSSEAGLDAEEASDDPLGAWWRAYLRGAVPKPDPVSHGRMVPIRTVDLFAGAGGLMLGVRQLAAEAGRRVICELAVDTDADALAVHVRNHRTRRLSTESVTSLVDYRTRGTGSTTEFVYPPTLVADRLVGSDEVDLVVAGPPCQGHSNLNNHSRRNDRRNLLYLTVPAFAVACGAKAVVIENVASVVHDKTDVVHATRRLLESCDYAVTQGILAADAMGWPQTRKRHFLVARRIVDSDAEPPVPIGDVQAVLEDSPPRSVLWAIGSGQTMSHDLRLHTATDLAALNRDRIRWLFDNDEHDLALAERPDCHQNGTSYGAVYGRMYADRPAPTITTGYMTPGRGRFVHPTEPRTLTPAEAARLQGFPDDYVFNPDPDQPASRSQLAKWIGDAVATPLGYAAAFCALAPDIGTSTI